MNDGKKMRGMSLIQLMILLAAIGVAVSVAARYLLG